jgi:hypothetical protein
VHARRSDIPDEHFCLRRMRALRIPVLEGGFVAYEDCVFALTRFQLGCDELSDAARRLLQRVRAFNDSGTEFQLHYAICAHRLVYVFLSCS